MGEVAESGRVRVARKNFEKFFGYTSEQIWGVLAWLFSKRLSFFAWAHLGNLSNPLGIDCVWPVPRERATPEEPLRGIRFGLDNKTCPWRRRCSDLDEMECLRRVLPWSIDLLRRVSLGRRSPPSRKAPPRGPSPLLKPRRETEQILRQG